jgi:hypothetical protein
MARKVEVGAGIATVVLSVIALAVLLLAPLAPVCPVALTAAGRCPAPLHYITLPRAGLTTSQWSYLAFMLILPLAGAAGAILDGELGERRGLLLLWGGAVLAFAGCAMTATGVGLFYLPPVLALLIAAYAALIRQLRAMPRAGDGAVGPRDVAGRARRPFRPS